MWTVGNPAAFIAVLSPFESRADRLSGNANAGVRRRKKASIRRFWTGRAGGWVLRGGENHASRETWIWRSLGLQFVGALALLMAVYLREGKAASGRVLYPEPVQGWFLHDRWLEIVLIGAILACGVLLLTGYRRLSAQHERTDTLLRSVTGSLALVVEEKLEAWGLTSSERDIAQLAIKGCSTADIARLRQTAEVTIRVQLSTIYRKAGVDGRVGLVGQLIEGLIDDSSDQVGSHRNAPATVARME